MVQVNAVIQGVVAAGAILGLVVLYIDRMSTISKNLEQLTDTLAGVEDEVRQVDLKEMEKTSNKLETYLNMELNNNYGPNGGANGGPNSVIVPLDELEMRATVSYVGDPDWHAGISAHEDLDGVTETIFRIEFNEEVDTHGLVGLLTGDDKLAEAEQNTFGEGATRFSADSPYLVTCSVPTDDLGEISDWIAEVLESCTRHIKRMTDHRAEFDNEVASKLGPETKIR